MTTNILERTNNELFSAEIKLQRALSSEKDEKDEKCDPVSGFLLKEIEAWLNATPKGKIILRRNGADL